MRPRPGWAWNGPLPSNPHAGRRGAAGRPRRQPPGIDRTRTTSIGRLPACTASGVAVANPSRTRTVNVSVVKPCASMIASVTPSGLPASNLDGVTGRADRRLGFGRWKGFVPQTDGVKAMESGSASSKHHRGLQEPAPACLTASETFKFPTPIRHLALNARCPRPRTRTMVLAVTLRTQMPLRPDQ
jgi:hypothetical protein